MTAPIPPNGAGPAGGPPPVSGNPMLPPQPSDYQFGVDALVSPRGNWVVIQVHTHIGMAVYFVKPDQAKAIAALLEQEATKAGTGLHLPPGGGGLATPGGG